MSASRFCGQCGTALAADTRFCWSCGAAVAGEAPLGAVAPVVSAPAAADVSAPRRRRLMPLIAMAVAVLAISGVVAARTGALPGLSGGPALAAVGMRVPPPTGWEEVQSEYGQMMALLEDDLMAGAPQGPRIQVRPADLYGTPALWGTGGFPDAGSSVSVREGPSAITVGSPGREGVEVIVQEGPGDAGGAGVITRYVIVTLGDGRAVLITMEAPANRFDSYRAAFDAALQNASFAR